MAISLFWTVSILFSLLYAAATGRAEAVGSAAMEGACAAVELCIAMGGMICLWSGVIELLEKAGVSASVRRLLRPVLSRLFPLSSRDSETFGALCTNASANLLGLGNAATPAGIRAAKGMHALGAENELTRLVVMNTASIQLLPTTVAAVRAAAGCTSPFDILPCVWISSLCAVTAGLAVSRALEGRAG